VASIPFRKTAMKKLGSFKPAKTGTHVVKPKGVK
jgi:hypothetical protein